MQKLPSPPEIKEMVDGGNLGSGILQGKYGGTMVIAAAMKGPKEDRPPRYTVTSEDKPSSTRVVVPPSPNNNKEQKKEGEQKETPKPPPPAEITR